MKKAVVFLLSLLAVFAIVSCEDSHKQDDTPVTPPQPATFVVTFDTQGGSSIDPATVEKDALVSKPADPTKGELVFRGWFTDAECTAGYDFNTPVTKSFTLYAKWTELDELYYRLTATRGAKRFALQYIGDNGIEEGINPKAGDTLTLKYRSNHPVTRFYLRDEEENVKFLYKYDIKEKDDYVSEPDEDGWITFTFVYPETPSSGSYDEDEGTVPGFRIEFANYTDGTHAEGKGPFETGDYLDIMDLSFNGTKLTIDPADASNNYQSVHGVWNATNTDHTRPTLEERYL
jgi:uncharacterized repeat protein (TIGR02543 family)